MSLSLCMIVKNEQENLPRCLESVKDIVDEMIIVDTGSTDETVKIAEEFGAKVFHFPWNGSFSDARNVSLRNAGCDWILLMDADDELEKTQRQEVLSLADKNEADAYFFLTVSYLGEKPGNEVMNNLNVRLLKNGKGYFFSSPIHEQIYSNIMAINPNALILNKDIKVYHYGYLNKNVLYQDKRNRNIGILEKELEQNPGYVFALFNLGNEYFAMGNYLKALEYYEASHEKFDPPQGYSSKLILKLANCYMNLGRHDDALRTIDEGLGYYAGFTDLMFFKALTYSMQQKYTMAIRCYENCARMGEAPLHLSVIAGSGTYRPYYMLGEIYYLLEDYESAIVNYSLSMQQNKEFTAPAANLIKAFCKKRPGKSELMAFLNDFLQKGVKELSSIIIDVLIAEGYYELALQYIKKRSHESDSPALEYQRGICSFFLKNFRSAAVSMKRLDKDPEYSAKAVCIQALCKTLEKKYAHARALLLKGAQPPQDKYVQVYGMLIQILETGETGVLSEEEKDSEQYTQIIFEILEALIKLHEFDEFEKALNLLNTVSDKTVLTKLGMLYYGKNCYELAYKELMRSIKIFDYITPEGASALYKLKLKGLG